MIIVPKVLHELLELVSEEQGKALALDYAQHVLDGCGTALEGDELAACLGYLDAAAAFSGDSASREALHAASEEFFAARRNALDFAGLVSWLPHTAVDVVAQRAMESAGLRMRTRYVPSVGAVAREAQRIMGTWAGAAVCAAESAAVAREARWEEGRWQLQRLVATAPYPQHG